ncbi:MAG: DNA polymerase Y family protein [Pacificimonas sp.]|jgi:protein ImuB|nr:DNA polymerase Y family protein [Pacificimonas sp.]
MSQPRRIVSVWMPHFAMDRRLRAKPALRELDIPIVMARQAAHGFVIHDLDSRAIAAGLRVGQRLTDARAIAGRIHVEPADPTEDGNDLKKLASWSRRWCPTVRSDRLEGLLLNITGCAHLFGGEPELLAQMTAAFQDLGLENRLAVADTIGAAWGLARFGTDSPITSNPRALETLPVVALRLEPDTILLLKRLGLKTVGDLAAVPRNSLMRRFRKGEPSTNPLIRLDHMFGRLSEPLEAQTEAVPLRAVQRFPEPLGDLAGLEQSLVGLIRDLAASLRRENRGVRTLRYTAYRVDGEALSVDINSGLATRDANHIVRLFSGKLDILDPGFGVDAATLDAVHIDYLSGIQSDLANSVEFRLDIARLVDRLIQRFGRWGIAILRNAGSHMPERSHRLTFFTNDRPGTASHPVRRDYLPIRLFRRPERAKVVHAVFEGRPDRMCWRGRSGRIFRGEGPERIAPEWWRHKGRALLRDYFRAEKDTNHRIWLYSAQRSVSDHPCAFGWYVHGIDG